MGRLLVVVRASQAQRRAREEGVVGLWGDMAEDGSHPLRSGWAGRAREQRPQTRVRLHLAPSVPACDPGQVPGSRQPLSPAAAQG